MVRFQDNFIQIGQPLRAHELHEQAPYEPLDPPVVLRNHSQKQVYVPLIERLKHPYEEEVYCKAGDYIHLCC